MRFIPSALFSLLCLLAILALFLLSRQNYLLFHNLVELSSIALAITLFSIAWNTRDITRNEPLTLLAVSFLAIGLIDLLHTLSYKGMGIFPGAGVDPPTQFWIAARLMESLSYLAAALLLKRSFRLNTSVAAVTYAVATALLIATIWPLKIFPSCLVEGQGLTTFKISAEYVLSVILAISGAIIWNHRERIPRPLLILLLWAIILSILSKMSFTLYTDVYGFNNVLGHILRFGSVLLVYRAIALGALKDPFQTLFRDLAISHQALDAELIQRKQTEQALRKTNRELDGFVHTVSHDLRSPLTVITGSAEVLRSELAEKIDKPYLNLLDNIENRGHHMASLLNNLLSLASIGRIEKPTETVETGSVVAQVVEDLRQEVIAANCQLVVEELPPLQGHVSLIYQLFLNLLSNALRYGANPEQAIVVSANKQENTIELIVSDHGPGIDKQERETIFDVFYRGVSDPQKPGTGIGLASIKKIAHYYGGEIRVEETPGGGATFRVMLPQPENDS